MENQLEIIKSNLPYGYEGIIAEKVGCSKPDISAEPKKRLSLKTAVYLLLTFLMNNHGNGSV